MNLFGGVIPITGITFFMFCIFSVLFVNIYLFYYKKTTHFFTIILYHLNCKIAIDFAYFRRFIILIIYNKCKLIKEKRGLSMFYLVLLVLSAT